MMSVICAETHSLSFSALKAFGASEAPALITKVVIRYAPLKPLECIPAQTY